jgi:hypothetical protein
MSIWDDSEHPDTQRVRDLKAEIERLRVLLKKSLDFSNLPHNGDPTPELQMRHEIIAALGVEQSPSGPPKGYKADREWQGGQGGQDAD